MAEPNEVLQGVQNEPHMFLFYCPGCDQPHGVTVNGYKNGVGASWGWNGSKVSPTFTPSLRTFDNEGTICHSFITDGRIQYLGDCRHKMAGQTVDIPAWEKCWPGE